MRTRLGVAVVIVVLSACGSSKASSPPGTRPTTTTSRSATTTTAPCSFTGSAGRSEQPATGGGPFLLADVTASAHDCTDTISFTFRPVSPKGSPPYVIEPAQPPFFQAGSGAPITVKGTKFLRVIFQPSWTYDMEAPNAAPTYTGPREFDPADVPGVHLALFDAYEAHVGWIIGLDGNGQYLVATSDSPPGVTITVGR